MPGIVQYVQQKKEKHDNKGNYCYNIQTIRYQEPALHVWYFLIRYYYLSTSFSLYQVTFPGEYHPCSGERMDGRELDEKGPVTGTPYLCIALLRIHRMRNYR